MQIKFAKRFTKQYDRAPVKIKNAVDERLTLFLLNPLNRQLNNHPLKEKLAGFRSVNITGDWRALYSEYIDRQNNKIIVFEILGTHGQLYK